MTSLQSTCAQMARLQTMGSYIALQRLHLEQAAKRTGAPQRQMPLRIGAEIAFDQFRYCADDFAAAVSHRAAANESRMEPEAA